jgi:hypothetical protein
LNRLKTRKKKCKNRWNPPLTTKTKEWKPLPAVKMQRQLKLLLLKVQMKMNKRNDKIYQKKLLNYEGILHTMQKKL